MGRTGSLPLKKQNWDQTLGNGAYRPVRLLGRGGMGEIYEAEEKATGVRVVVKLLRKELVSQPDMVDRMRVEADALQRIRHPNVVRARARGWTRAGRPFLVLECLRGRTIEEELQIRGSLPFLEALGRAQELLSALAAVHEAGIVHRDVKPDNLFLSCAPEGRILKLIDFGIARVTGAGAARGLLPLAYPTAVGTRIGTPRYAAPEQARGAIADARADIYGAGLVLYLLLAGHGPFADIRGAGALFRAQASRIPEAPSRWARQPIPPALDGIVLRALAKRPEDRFPDALSFSRELRSVVEHCTSAQESGLGMERMGLRIPLRGKTEPEARRSAVTGPWARVAERASGWGDGISMSGIGVSAALFAILASAFAMLLDR